MNWNYTDVYNLPLYQFGEILLCVLCLLLMVYVIYTTFEISEYLIDKVYGIIDTFSRKE